MKSVSLSMLPVLLLAGCTPRPLPVSGGPQPIQVPPGCEANLAGEYLEQDQRSFRYEGSDDGGTLQLVLERAPEDAGVQRARQWDPVIRLERTPHGFVGETRAFVFEPHRCPVRFPTELTACADGGLTLRSAQKLAVDPDSCNVDPAAPVMRTYRLVQVPQQHAPDAGVATPAAAPSAAPSTPPAPDAGASR